MALFTILEESVAPPKFVRVRVDLTDESIFLKLPTSPTQDQVDWEVIYYLTEREKAANGITE